jgi:ubiquinone/menaquinone biosynthesis C-methylase UbiE
MVLMMNINKINHEGFNKYYQTVLGSPRARHTFFRRLSAIEDMIGGFENKFVLDVGCGYGFNIVRCANKCKRIIGVDLDIDRIIAARKYKKYEKIQNISFSCGNAERLPFSDGMFDVVMGNEFLHHVHNPQKAINEMVRVTKKRGCVLISDHNGLSILSETLRKKAFGKDRCRTFTKKEVNILFEKANLKKIRARYIIFTLPFRSVPSWLIRINSFFEYLLEKIPLLNTQCGVFVIKGEKI